MLVLSDKEEVFIMKRKLLIYSILITSLVLNLILIREFFLYVPDQIKFRFYYRIRQKGWIDKTYPLSLIHEPNTFVILTLGQSNAANTSNDIYQPLESVYSFSHGKLYRAEEPLIGTEGSGCSVWTRLADKLISEGLCDQVILVPIALGNTDIKSWAQGDGNLRLKKTLYDLDEKDIRLTHILWHQGEADNGKSPIEYKTGLDTILSTIRSNNQDAPFFCSIATFVPYSNYQDYGVDFQLQNAQKSFIKDNESVFEGPNTDKLIYAIHRRDGIHFSGYGNQKYAELWYEALTNKKDHLDLNVSN